MASILMGHVRIRFCPCSSRNRCWFQGWLSAGGSAPVEIRLPVGDRLLTLSGSLTRPSNGD